MKTFRNPVPALALLTLCLACNSRFSIGFAQGTAFTYQGRLNDNGVPVTGNYDVQFALYTTNVMGNPVAGPSRTLPRWSATACSP
jgi:hypothetical protein